MTYTVFTLAELREIANDPDRVENMFRWIRPNQTWFEPKNLRVTPFDADEIRARPFELSSDGEQVLLGKTYFVVDKCDGCIEEVSLLDMCERCDIDPVRYDMPTVAEWVDALDAQVMQVSMKGVDWIEFRTLDEAREWATENVLEF